MARRVMKLESEKKEEREKRVPLEMEVGGLREEVGGLREELRVAKDLKQSSPVVNAETLKWPKGWRAMFQVRSLHLPALAVLGFMNQDAKHLRT